MTDETGNSKFYPLRKEKVKVSDGGRIVIPSEVRQAMGIAPGDEVILSYDGGSLSVYSLKEAIRRAKTVVARHVGEGRSLSEELIADRRKERGDGWPFCCGFIGHPCSFGKRAWCRRSRKRVASRFCDKFRQLV